MTDNDPFQIEALLGSHTDLRATAAALAMVMAGERPSLSRVAATIGLTRQALLKDHKPVTQFVAALRAAWKPPPDAPVSKLGRDLDEVRTLLRAERSARRNAEAQRDRALHHLQLAEATLRAVEQESSPVRTLPPRTSHDSPPQ